MVVVVVMMKNEISTDGGRAGSVSGVGRGSSDSGQGVGVCSVVSQARRRGSDGWRRRRATAGHAGRVMVEWTLVVLLVMVVGHVVHGSGVRARVHSIVMMMAGRRRVRVRMMRRAEVRVTLMQLVHLHLGRLGVLGARGRAGRGAWK